MYRRKRKTLHKIRQRHVVYRIGDKVEIKSYSRRSSRPRWTPGEVWEVWRDEIYGGLTYSILLKRSGKIKDFIQNDELRFRDPLDLEKRWREDEIVREDEIARQENIKQFEVELARQRREREYSNRGRRPQRPARDIEHHRARSVNENYYFSERANLPEDRAMSVPPTDYNWQDVFTYVANNVRKDGQAPPEFKEDENDRVRFNDKVPYNGRGTNVRDDIIQYDDDHIDDQVRDDWDKREPDYRDIDADVNPRLDNVGDSVVCHRGNSEGAYPAHQDIYIGDHQQTYEVNLRDHMEKRGIMKRGGINLNIVLPSRTRVQNEREL